MTLNPKRRKSADRTSWSAERWMNHLLANATTESERSEIQAIFTRDDFDYAPAHTAA